MTGSLRKVVVSGFAAWVAFGLVGLYFLMPLREKLRFGIDLVGGTYITLDVKVEKAVESELIDLLEQMKTALVPAHGSALHHMAAPARAMC